LHHELFVNGELFPKPKTARPDVSEFGWGIDGLAQFALRATLPRAQRVTPPRPALAMRGEMPEVLICN
jgi:hypothetical protein